MTKIEERKQYKFSEIIAMLENKELPEGTKVTLCHSSNLYYYAGEGEVGFWLYDHYGVTPPTGSTHINYEWTIKLPKEDKFYLKAPDCFMKGKFLNWDCRKDVDKCFFAGTEENWTITTRFTQKEIDSMPFDTKFFEKIKAEQ
ncbi:hypothetical protein, partial [Carnobacterium maltaromaticum]